MPRSRTKHENIMMGERIPKKFAFNYYSRFVFISSSAPRNTTL